MQTTHSTRTCRAFALILALMTVACDRRDADGEGLDTSTVGGTVALDSANRSADSMAAPTTDAGWLSFIMNVDRGEVEAGRLALTKAQRAPVREFAQMMVDEHSRDSAQVAGLQGATTDSMAHDQGGVTATMKASHERTMGTLRSTSGTAFDSAYVQAMIAGHQQVLDVLRSGNTASGDVSSHLTAVRSVVERHLARARELQATPADSAR